MTQYEVHISQIRVGDTVFHDGHARTVTRNHLNRGFMGITLFGDSYRLGTIPVLKVVYEKPSS